MAIINMAIIRRYFSLSVFSLICVSLYFWSFKSSNDTKEEMVEPDEFMMKMEEKFRKINRNVEHVCKAIKDQIHGELDVKATVANMLSFTKLNLVYPEARLSYCPQPKVGTHTWMAHFETIAEKSGKTLNKNVRDIHDRVGNAFKFPEKEINLMAERIGRNMLKVSELMDRFVRERNLFHFSFVRHPFERVASFFANEVIEVDGRVESNSFSKFVDKHLKVYEDKGCLKNPYCLLNPHFRPLLARCMYCDMTYHVIGKHETFDEDAAYIIRKLNLTDFVKPDLHLFQFVINKDGNVTRPKQDQPTRIKLPTERALGLYRQLSRKQLDRLFMIYKWDFLLFDYDYEPYFAVVKSE